MTQSMMVLGVLSNLLSEQNSASFASLQEAGLGSQAVLNVTEKYSFYVGRAINKGNDDDIFQSEENLCEIHVYNFVVVIGHILCQSLLFQYFNPQELTLTTYHHTWTILVLIFQK